MPSDVVVRGGVEQAELAWPMVCELGVVPADPFAVVPAVFVPPPPPMSAYPNDVGALARLWATRAPNAAMRRRRSTPREDTLQLLRCAAAVFRELEFAPGAWVAWTADDWRHRLGNNGPAPMLYTFGPGRLCDEHVLGLFLRAAGNYSGGTLIPFGRSQRTLVETYNAMKREIVTGPIERARVEGIVAKHFPPGRYRRLVFLAERETAAVRSQIAADVAAGECVW